jgi:hypothetical protein
MKKRNLVSLLVAFSFLVLAVTGLIIFLSPSSKFVDTLHSSMGVVFISFAVLHLFNNFKSLKGYFWKS